MRYVILCAREKMPLSRAPYTFESKSKRETHQQMR